MQRNKSLIFWGGLIHFKTYFLFTAKCSVTPTPEPGAIQDIWHVQQLTPGGLTIPTTSVGLTLCAEHTCRPPWGRADGMGSWAAAGRKTLAGSWQPQLNLQGGMELSAPHPGLAGVIRGISAWDEGEPASDCPFQVFVLDQLSVSVDGLP